MDKYTPLHQDVRYRVATFFSHLFLSLVVVALAAALRIWPLEGLGLRLAYLGRFKQKESKFHEIFINARYGKGLNYIRTSQI